MDWFRVYHGISTDPKLHKASRLAGVSRGLMVGAWLAILDHASQQEVRGDASGLDPDTLAFMADVKPAVAARILGAAETLGMLAGGMVASWDKRQRESDDVWKRVKAHRDRKVKPLIPNGSDPENSVTVPFSRTEQNRIESEETLMAAAVSLPPAPASAREEAPPPGVPAAAAAEDDGSAEVLVQVLYERVAPAGVSRPQVRREVGAWVRQLGLPAAEAAVYEALRSARRNPMSLCGTIVATRHAGRLAAEAAARSPPPEPLGIVRAVQLAAAATDRLKEASHDEPVFLGREFDRECEGMFDPPAARH